MSKPVLGTMQVPQGQGITVLEDQNDSDPDADSVADSDVDSSASELGTDASVQKADSPTTAPMQKAGKASKTATGISVQSQDDEQTELQQYENAQERREELKQQLAVTASKVLQNPEAHLPTLKSVLALAADQDAQVLFACHFCMPQCLHHLQWSVS